MKSSPMAFILATMLFLSGCSSGLVSHGNFPDPDAVGQIKIGESTQDDILILLGTPSTQFVYGLQSWQYISVKAETVAFFEPDVLERQILDITFDEQGVVDSIALYDQSHGETIAFVDRSTQTPGTDLSLLQQLMGNIGRFSGQGSQ